MEQHEFGSSFPGYEPGHWGVRFPTLAFSDILPQTTPYLLLLAQPSYYYVWPPQDPAGHQVAGGDDLTWLVSSPIPIPIPIPVSTLCVSLAAPHGPSVT